MNPDSRGDRAIKKTSACEIQDPLSKNGKSERHLDYFAKLNTFFLFLVNSFSGNKDGIHNKRTEREHVI